uniref:Uncharacterized protein n=1 Tax=Nelumbo nucifera TaxID=4432 RepID=A0A822Y8H2_NELNU|nr:TPA_asm: hypothetical protein HUJ06_028964 [Nelumbo nucifera]
MDILNFHRLIADSECFQCVFSGIFSSRREFFWFFVSFGVFSEMGLCHLVSVLASNFDQTRDTHFRERYF